MRLTIARAARVAGFSLASPAVGRGVAGSLGGGLGEGAARRQFDEFLRLEAIGAEDALDLGEFGFVGGIARAAEPMGPIGMVREFFAPASEVQADFALVGTVLEAMVLVIGGVGRSARIVVKMGLFGHSG